MLLKKLSVFYRNLYNVHIMIKKLSYLLVFLFVVALFVSPFFIKVTIECESQYGKCPDEINSNLASLKTKNLFDARQKANTYLKNNFLVSDSSIQFKLPNIMLVNVIAKKPYFAIKDSSSGKIMLIDKNGIVLAESENSGLPTIEAADSLKKIGEEVDKRNLFALNLISGINEMYQVRYGMIANDALTVDIPHGLRVIFPLEGDSEVLLGGLRLIYAKVTADYLGTYSQIDMRYKNPVLK
jgi:hypothetical protein